MVKICGDRLKSYLLAALMCLEDNQEWVAVHMMIRSHTYGVDSCDNTCTN